MDASLTEKDLFKHPCAASGDQTVPTAMARTAGIRLRAFALETPTARRRRRPSIQRRVSRPRRIRPPVIVGCELQCQGCNHADAGDPDQLAETRPPAAAEMTNLGARYERYHQNSDRRAEQQNQMTDGRHMLQRGLIEGCCQAPKARGPSIRFRPRRLTSSELDGAAT